MYFDSIQELVQMSGHGAYVWAAYGLSFAVIIGLIVAPLRRQAELKKQIRQLSRRDA